MATATDTATILLKLTSDMADIRKAQEEFRKLKEEGNKTAKELSQSFGATMAALNLFGGMVSALRGYMSGVTTDGVAFNKTMEQAAGGVAAVLQQANPYKFKDFQSAMKASASALGDLRKRSNEAGLSTGDLIQNFQMVAPILSQARVPVEQQTKVVTDAAKAMATLGISAGDTRKELLALFTGTNLNRSKLASGLQISKQDLDNARQQGKLVDYILGRIEEFNRGTAGMQETTITLETRLKDTVTQTAADATKDLTAAYKDLLRTLNDLAGSDAAKSFFKSAADWAKSGVGVANSAVKFAKSNPEAVDAASGMAMAVGALIGGGWLLKIIQASIAPIGALGVPALVPIVVAALAGAGYAMAKGVYDRRETNANNWMAAASGQVKQATEGVLSAKTYEQLDSEIARITKLRASYVEQRGTIEKNLDLGWGDKKQFDAFYDSILSSLDNIIKSSGSFHDGIIEQNRALEKQAGKTEEISKENEAKDNRRASALADYKKNLEAVNKGEFDALDTREKYNALLDKAAALQKEISGITPEQFAAVDPKTGKVNVTDDDRRAAESAKNEAIASLLKTQAELSALEKKINEENRAFWAGIAKDSAQAAKDREKAVVDTLKGQEQALQKELAELSVQKAENESDRTKSDIERRTENVRLLREERDKMQELIDKLEELRDSYDGDETAQQLVSSRLDAMQLEARKKDVDISNAKNNMPARGVARFSEEMKHLREQSDPVFEVMNAGFHSMASGIEDALVNARNLGEGFKAVLGSIAKGIADAVIQIIAMKIAMAAVKGMMGIAGFSDGGGVPGLATGGYTADVGTLKPAGIVHGGEWVAPEWMVKGAESGPVISALENMRVARRGFAAGGETTAGAVMAMAQQAETETTGDTYHFSYTFQSGVTRAEVAALIPMIQEKTIAAVADRQRRRKM